MPVENRPIRSQHISGYTLVELLITLTIVGILLGVAVSGYSGWLSRTKTEEMAASLQRSLTHARSEAIKYGGGIRFCGSEDGATCASSLNGGWIVFRDADNSAQVDNGETVISVVRVDDSNVQIAMEDSVNATTSSQVFYNHRGYSNPAVSVTVERGNYSENFSMSRSGNVE